MHCRRRLDVQHVANNGFAAYTEVKLYRIGLEATDAAQAYKQWRRNEFESEGGGKRPTRSAGKNLSCPFTFWLNKYK